VEVNVDRQRPLTEPDYEPPLDKECGIMIVLETKEDVARFVAANRGEEDNGRKACPIATETRQRAA